MNGYVEAGYLVAIGTLSSYGASIVLRERAARRRLPPSRSGLGLPSPTDVLLEQTDPVAEFDDGQDG